MTFLGALVPLRASLTYVRCIVPIRNVLTEDATHWLCYGIGCMQHIPPSLHQPMRLLSCYNIAQESRTWLSLSRQHHCFAPLSVPCPRLRVLMGSTLACIVESISSSFAVPELGQSCRLWRRAVPAGFEWRSMPAPPQLNFAATAVQVGTHILVVKVLAGSAAKQLSVSTSLRLPVPRVGLGTRAGAFGSSNASVWKAADNAHS